MAYHSPISPATGANNIAIIWSNKGARRRFAAAFYSRAMAYLTAPLSAGGVQRPQPGENEQVVMSIERCCFCGHNRCTETCPASENPADFIDT